jgi:hypothetical protein
LLTIIACMQCSRRKVRGTINTSHIVLTTYNSGGVLKCPANDKNAALP